MYRALYRSFRPETFDQVLGQEHIVKILKHQIRNRKIGHAYLFCGTRGTGKTTLARILAKGINCLSENEEKPCGICSNCVNIKEGTHIDVIEIDAASNNGVDNIREINESVAYPPIAGNYKVYIIDEVHMLSNSAFNALLKTLEEPSEYIVFIMATTEPERLPKTILSRCLRLDFRRVSEEVIKKGMVDICRNLDVEIEPEGLAIIAKNADGSVRDGLSILDQCMASGNKKISREEILENLGALGEEAYIELTDAVMDRDPAGALLLINHMVNRGKDEKQMFKDWIAHYRNLMMASCLDSPEDMMSLSIENINRLKEQADKMNLNDINRGIMTLSKIALEAKWSTQARVLLEVAAVNLASDYEEEMDPDEIFKSGKRNRVKRTKEVEASEKINKNKKPKPEKKEPGERKTKESFGNADKDIESVKTDLDDAEGKESDLNIGKEQIFDLKELWNNTLQRGRESLAMIPFMMSGASIRDLGDKEIVILVRNETTERAVKLNEQVLRNILKELTGRDREIIFKRLDGEEGDKKETPEDVAKKLESSLGISVDVE